MKTHKNYDLCRFSGNCLGIILGKEYSRMNKENSVKTSVQIVTQKMLEILVLQSFGFGKRICRRVMLRVPTREEQEWFLELVACVNLLFYVNSDIPRLLLSIKSWFSTLDKNH